MSALLKDGMLEASHDKQFLSSPAELVEEARRGRMFILTDDEDRENEGDLVIPAEFCGPEAINFMARYGRGLICLAMTRQRCKDLCLPLMAQGHEARSTAFTLSIEAREGVTTGISAADRARTVQAAVADGATHLDIRTPGHIFPLMARDGGVLVRAGHTEASVDIARLAGLKPAGVICEIMNDDGSMARLPDLVPFAQHHGLKIGTIADMIDYRLKTDTLIRRLSRNPFESRFGGTFELSVYESMIDGVEHVALTMGDVASGGPVLTRVHNLDLIHDVLGAPGPDQLHRAMEEIARVGRGVVVLLRYPNATGVTQSLAKADPQNAGKPRDLRVYGIGAQILRDLGVHDMILLSSRSVGPVALEGYGLQVVKRKDF